MYMLFSDVIPTAGFPMTQAEKFPTLFLLKSDVNLFNHRLGKRMLRVVVCVTLFFVDRLPGIPVLDGIVWSCFYVKLMQTN